MNPNDMPGPQHSAMSRLSLGARVSTLMTRIDPLLSVRLIYRHRDLVWQMLQRNLASRYRGSILGFVWSFAHPLMMLAVYTFVFGVVFKARWGVEHFADNRAAFPMIMFCGMAVYNIFAESVNTSAGLVVNNASLVKKVIFPLEILPLCNVLASLVFGIAWFALLLLGTVVFLGQFSWTMLLLPIVLLPLLLLSAGVSFLVASLGVYLRDIPQVVAIITQILFFMTPIFYPISLVPEKVRWVLHINPLTVIVEQARNVFLFGQTPDFWPTAAVYIVAGIVFQLGLLWFTKTKKGFADVL